VQACESVAKENDIQIAVCPPMVELSRIASQTSIPVFSQSVDAARPGSSTGWVPVESLNIPNVTGTLLNHSEHRMGIADIEFCVNALRKLNLLSIVCTNNDHVSRACAAFKPDFVAIEPPELIGGDVSVTDANPDIISKSIESVRSISRDTKILTGAGVKRGADVKNALKLGCDGVLLASGVVKAKDPKEALLELAPGIA